MLEPLTGTLLGITFFGERVATHDLQSGLTLGLAAAAIVIGVWRLGEAPLLEEGSRAPAGLMMSQPGSPDGGVPSR